MERKQLNRVRVPVRTKNEKSFTLEMRAPERVEKIHVLATAPKSGFGQGLGADPKADFGKLEKSGRSRDLPLVGFRSLRHV